MIFGKNYKKGQSPSKDRLQHSYQRQITCMAVVGPIVADIFTFISNCTTVSLASE